MDLDRRMNVARFQLNNSINCLHYFEELRTLVVGFESGLMKSYLFRMAETDKWGVQSKNDLIQHFSLQSKMLIQGRNFTETIEHNDHELVGLQTLKIFSSAVTHLIAHETRQTIVFRSNQHELFFMKMQMSKSGKLKVAPLFLLQMEARIRDFQFHSEGKRVMFALTTGNVLSVEIPPETDIDNRRNYLVDLKDARLKTRIARMTMMQFQKPQLDENDLFYVLNGSTGEENVEWDPEPISVLLDVQCKRSIGQLGQLIQNQIEESRQLEEQMKEEHSKEKERDKPEAETEALVAPQVPIESVKIGDRVDFSQIDQKDLVLVASEGNFLGFLYLLEIRDYLGKWTGLLKTGSN